MDNEIAELIEVIERTLVNASVLGFDPSIFSTLDDVEIGQREIENLKAKLGVEVFTYLFNIANSSYHGSLKMGPVKHFFDVVNRLGMQYTKALILQIALRRLARGDHHAEVVFAKSFGASVLGRIMARNFGFRDDAARQVELAGLLANVGALMMIVYRNRFYTGDSEISNDIIEKNHLYLTERIIHRFNLPEYLYEMVLTEGFTLERMEIGLAAVVKLAMCAVDSSFRYRDNRLIFRVPASTAEEGMTPSLGEVIEEQFTAAGLRKYLAIVPMDDQETR